MSTSDTGTTPQQSFDAALADMLAEVKRVCDVNDRRFPNLPQGMTIVHADKGPVYVRISTRAPHGGSSAYGFVRKSDGAILYAAGWKKPFIAKAGPDSPATVRGNIYNSDTWGCLGPYGVRTIR